MKGKELRALITLAGKVDPSLQASMLKASKQSKKTSKVFKKALGSVNKGVLKVAGKISPAFSAGLTKVESKATKAFGVVRKGAGYVGKGFKAAGKVAKGMALGIGAAATVATAAVAPLAKQGLEYASNMSEVQNVVDTTFGQGSSVINEFSKTSLKAYGLSSLQAKEYSSVLGSMYKSMGLGSKETLTMSQNMTALAGDMASFYNLDPSDAFEKIRAGVSGETEPLKQLGINMSVANLEAFAMSKGISQSYKDMSQAEQSTLRYNYLLSATSDAQGDFAKTSGGYANQQRLFQVTLQQVSGEVMQNMIPAMSSGLQKINTFLSGLDTAAIGNFVGGIANMAVSFLPLVFQLLPLFGNLLNMILPPLINIGQQIMPIIILAIQTMLAVIQPLIPPIMQFVQALLPPIMQVLTAISPMLISLANIIGAILGPALNSLVGLITKIAELVSKVAKPIGDFFGKIGSFFGLGGNKQIDINAKAKLPAYANGGFANSPSIFGEAGLEAAIPIKPGNPRSIRLLSETAKMLGFQHDESPYNMSDKSLYSPRISRISKVVNESKSKRPIYFTYAPVFKGGEKPTEHFLKQDAQQIGRILDDYFLDKRRLEWD